VGSRSGFLSFSHQPPASGRPPRRAATRATAFHRLSRSPHGIKARYVLQRTQCIAIRYKCDMILVRYCIKKVLTPKDYESLAEVRHHIRRFLHFSELAVCQVGLEPRQHQLMLALKGLPRGTRPRWRTGRAVTNPAPQRGGTGGPASHWRICETTKG
jgi:hypothetical protein